MMLTNTRSLLISNALTGYSGRIPFRPDANRSDFNVTNPTHFGSQGLIPNFSIPSGLTEWVAPENTTDRDLTTLVEQNPQLQSLFARNKGF
jgi:hypothetical protein